MTVLELIEQPTNVGSLANRPPNEVKAADCYVATCRCGKRIVRYQGFPLESRLRESCYSCASSCG
jgi:hypothetical protein